MNDRRRILVCDDEPQIVRALRVILRDAGFEAVPANSGEEALDLVAVRPPQAAVLDLMLPDLDGVEVTRRIREWSEMPIVVLSAIGDEDKKVEALAAGADDYVTKPFGPRELVARVRAILRRSGGKTRPDGGVLRHGDLVLDAGRRECHVGEEEIRLAPKEFDLLWELLDHKGLVLTRDQLLERVWGYTFAGDTRTVDVHVRQLRRKLGEASPIVTVWGVGYKVGPERAPAPAA